MKNLWAKNGSPIWANIEKLDWFQALYDCPQDPVYHAEGNVGIHTKMVVEALQNLPEYTDLLRSEQQLLSWAALLHDIAKPVCLSTDEEGNIRAHQHSQKGELIVRNLLWDIDLEARELLCALVRLHGLPIWCMEKQNPYSSLYLASLRLPNKLLYLLAKADVLGRLSTGQTGFLERIELYKAFCIEQNCWDKPKAFYNEHSRYQFFAKNQNYPANLFDNTTFEIVVLVGLPGCGKDTYAAQLGLPIVSLDERRKEHKIKPTDKKGQGKVAQLAYELAKKYARKKQSFVWNSTNLTQKMRTRISSTLGVYNPRFKIIYIESSKANILKRRRKIIPAQKLNKMFQFLEFPLVSEGHELVWERN